MVKILRHEKMRAFWFEGEDVLSVWAKPHSKASSPEAAKLRAKLIRACKTTTVVGIIAAIVITVLFANLLDGPTLIAIWVAGTLGGPGLILGAAGQTWLERRFKNRRNYRLKRDQIEWYEPGGFVPKYKLGDDTRYRVEEEHLWLVSDKLPNGVYRVPLPRQSHQRKRLLDDLALLFEQSESEEPEAPVTKVFDFSDTRLRICVLGWTVVSILACAGVEMSSLVKPDYVLWVLLGLGLVTFAAGPGWLWVAWRFGRNALREKRYRGAAFIANCVTAMLVMFIGMIVLTLVRWRTVFG